MTQEEARQRIKESDVRHEAEKVTPVDFIDAYCDNRARVLHYMGLVEAYGDHANQRFRSITGYACETCRAGARQLFGQLAVVKSKRMGKNADVAQVGSAADL